MTQRILSPGNADQTITKSRFIAAAEYCDSERAVALMLRRLAAQHPHASHLAFACKIRGAEGILQRFHDAGEPSGTAGKPIMQYLEGRDLINACIAVVRYYGGINLGTGGLARAYGGTAKLALDAATLGDFVEMRRIRVALDYARLDHFLRETEKARGEILDKDFGERVTVIASVPADAAQALLERFAGD
ncbi:MAG: IMPACT family protein [Methylobacillus sp.]|jgi:uncharacterized YigZ family protein|nr:IMPACT family protein [Methylobacillus sp.]